MPLPVVDLNSVRLSTPQKSKKAYWEISWSAGDRKVWFRSKTELSLTADSTVCAFFLHRLAERIDFQGEQSFDAYFLENLPKIRTIAHNYWGFSGSLPDFPVTTTSRESISKTGMFFTGGVDSFYTLKRNYADLAFLINIHGFDITTDDRERFLASSEGIIKVGNTLGLDTIFVETNLRENPAFELLGWPQTHIAALASVAHMLSKSVGTVRVASSDVPPPHGSHPTLDNLWSSATVRLLNDEYDITRFDKIKEIVNWAPAQKFLKVCWENLSAELNCGRCEKCVRTQVAIKAVGGDLNHFETFSKRDLSAAIENLPFVRPHLVTQWRHLCRELDDPELISAITRLLIRSPAPAPLWKKRIKKLAKRFLGRS